MMKGIKKLTILSALLSILLLCCACGSKKILIKAEYPHFSEKVLVGEDARLYSDEDCRNEITIDKRTAEDNVVSFEAGVQAVADNYWFYPGTVFIYATSGSDALEGRLAADEIIRSHDGIDMFRIQSADTDEKDNSLTLIFYNALGNVALPGDCYIQTADSKIEASSAIVRYDSGEGMNYEEIIFSFQNDVKDFDPDNDKLVITSVISPKDFNIKCSSEQTEITVVGR